MTSVTNIEAGKELISKSMFLFGAGATRDAGCFVSNEMLNDIYQMDMSNPEIEAIDFLLSSLQYHASWKNLKEKKVVNAQNGHQANIEDLMLLIRRIVNRDSYLPFPITGSWADKINFLEIEWRTTEAYQKLTTKKPLFENLEERLVRQLYKWMWLGQENTDYLKPLDEYLKITESNSSLLNFFTLNYDLVFEKHFNSNDETLLNTGFSNGVFNGFGENPSASSHRIRYFKLHGSINWGKDETGLIKENFFYSKKPDHFCIRVDKETIEEKVASEFLLNPPGNPHVIFGQGGKFLSVDPFMKLLYNFKEQLSIKEVIFVVGYSFFDPYINNMLLEGLSKESINQKLMVVVNPQFNEGTLLDVEEKKYGESEKTELLKNKFIDYLQKVQKSTYLSDLPSFNLTEISPNKVKIIPQKSVDFFKDYFSNDGNGFIDLKNEISSFEREGDVF